MTTPQSAFGCQLPFTGEPLVRLQGSISDRPAAGSESRPYKVRCVGVDALIDPCREAAKGRRADVGIRPYGCGGIKKHPCLSRDKGAHLCGTTLVAKRPLFGV